MLVTLSKRDRTGTASTRARAHGKVLIAEDSGDVREMLQLLFETNGFDVIAASDGRNALRLALQSVPDLVLLDLQLPWIDGIAVARELRQNVRLKDTLIVIVSGHDPLDYRQKALAAGCDDYMQKPMDFERLEKLLKWTGGNKVLRAAG